MKLRLVRKHFSPQSTVGELHVDDRFECYTLEDRERPGQSKVYGQTAIPRGTYEVVVTPSPRFKRRLPLLVGVPGFAGIRVHSGNTAADTEGCILVGRTKGRDFVGESRPAFSALFAKIEKACALGRVTIEIV